MAMVAFSSGSIIKSADVNANFANSVACDTARTVTVTHSWTASQTFTGGFTAGAACTVSTGGLTVTAGGLTVSAGTSAVQALTATTGVFSGLITGNAGLSTTTGAFTGAVSGITTLSAASLTLTGVATVSQLNPAAAGTFKILGGTTGLSLRNNADSADNLILTDAGAATIRAGLTVTAGTTAVQALTATTGTFSGLLVGNAGLSTTTGAFTGAITGTTRVETAKLKGNSSAPGIANGTAIGTGGSVATSVTGTDLAGKIVITAGTTSLTSGSLCTVTFNSAYSATPFVLIHYDNHSSSTVLAYGVANVSTTGFTIDVPAAPSVGQQFAFYYTVVSG